MTDGIFVGGGGAEYAEAQELLLKYANRHGLIAGATGTGKTVTVQVMAQAFSDAGVPVFVSDVKGDLSGLGAAGAETHKLHAPFMERAQRIKLDLTYSAAPVTFWDLWGQQGHPVRATVAEMGPLLLSRMLALTEVQEGVLNIAFRIADEQGLPLLDLADLRSMLAWLGENRSEISLQYGNISPASVGAIQRSILMLENEGAAGFFGEPALELRDLMRVDDAGRGVVNILASDRLMQAPRLYATFLFWLLSELFEELPEVGDPDKPKLVFFFDEAHLLFDGTPKALVDKVEQVARLIRSKGVGVYFITQHPADIPEDILAQLGNRIQHALRAFTARDKKNLKLAAETYRENPAFSVEEAIREVGVGEAVTSFLEKKGVPGLSQRTLIRPPASRIGPLTVAERGAIVASSDLSAKYDMPIDRESAHEILTKRAEQAAVAAAQAEAAEEEAEVQEREYRTARRYTGARVSRSTSRKSSDDSFSGALTEALVKELKGTTGRRIVRGILGGLFKAR